jgi:hypothetical protein
LDHDALFVRAELILQICQVRHDFRLDIFLLIMRPDNL